MFPGLLQVLLQRPAGGAEVGPGRNTELRVRGQVGMRSVTGESPGQGGVGWPVPARGHWDAQAAHTSRHTGTQRLHGAVSLGTHSRLTNGDAAKEECSGPFDTKATVPCMGAVEQAQGRGQSPGHLSNISPGGEGPRSRPRHPPPELCPRVTTGRARCVTSGRGGCARRQAVFAGWKP